MNAFLLHSYKTSLPQYFLCPGEKNAEKSKCKILQFEMPSHHQLFVPFLFTFLSKPMFTPMIALKTNRHTEILEFWTLNSHLTTQDTFLGDLHINIHLHSSLYFVFLPWSTDRQTQVEFTFAKANILAGDWLGSYLQQHSPGPDCISNSETCTGCLPGA